MAVKNRAAASIFMYTANSNLFLSPSHGSFMCFTMILALLLSYKEIFEFEMFLTDPHANFKLNIRKQNQKICINMKTIKSNCSHFYIVLFQQYEKKFLFCTYISIYLFPEPRGREGGNLIMFQSLFYSINFRNYIKNYLVNNFCVEFITT